MNVLHLLTFPGAFTPGGLLGAGLQTSVWLALFWMSGYVLAVIFHALMSKEPGTIIPSSSMQTAAAASSVAVIAIALALTWITIAGEPHLPKLFIDRSESTVGLRYVHALLLFPSAVAFSCFGSGDARYSTYSSWWSCAGGWGKGSHRLILLADSVWRCMRPALSLSFH